MWSLIKATGVACDQGLHCLLIFNKYITNTAPIAQLVECPLSEQEVVGSNPSRTIPKCKKWY